MDTTSKSTQIPVAEVSDALEKMVAQFDQSRAGDLDEMTQARAAKFNGLARDRQRLTAKLGADNPRVVALGRSLQLNADTVVGFQSEIAGSSTPPPQVTATSWVLHGNVLDSARKPLAGLTVALYQKDSWQQSLGFACTDKNGYFVLKVEDAAKAGAGPWTLRVLRSRTVIYSDPRPVTIRAAHVEYREIVIGDTTGTCEPPTHYETPGASGRKDL
jgi:hypothetical protein